MSTQASALPAVLRALDEAGYELVGAGTRSRTIAPLRHVLETLLQDYGSDRRLFNGAPILLSKASEQELADLHDLKSDLVNPAGYLIDTTAHVLQRLGHAEDAYTQAAARLTTHLQYLRQRRSAQEYIIPRDLGPEKLKRLRWQRSDIAKRWKVIDFNRELEFEELLPRYW